MLAQHCYRVSGFYDVGPMLFRCGVVGWDGPIFLGGLNQFCPKNPGHSGNFSGRKNARLPQKNHFARPWGGCSPPAPWLIRLCLQKMSVRWIRNWGTVWVRGNFKLELRALVDNCTPFHKRNSKTNTNWNPNTISHPNLNPITTLTIKPYS